MTIQPILWYRPLKSGLHQIKIRVTENGKVKYFTTGIEIPKSQWNDKSREVRKSNPESDQLNNIIQSRVYTTSMEMNNRRSSKISSKTIQSVKSKPIEQLQTIEDLFLYHIDTQNSQGKIGNRKKYSTVLNHLNECRLNKVGINEFDSTHRIQFNDYLTNIARVQKHGAHTYNKVLKRVISHSIETGLRKNAHPYSGYKTPVPKSKTPRFLDDDKLYMMKELLINQRMSLNLESVSISAYLFSVYSYGMRFGYVVRLKWSDIKDSHLEYVMSKTDTHVRIPLAPEHYEILKLFLPEKIYPRIFKDEKFIAEGLKEQGLFHRFPILEHEETYYRTRMKYFDRLDQVSPKPKSLEEIHSLDLLTQEEKSEFKSALVQRDSILKSMVTDYSRNSSDYIFPLLENEKMSKDYEYTQVSSKNALVNKKLKIIAKKLNVSPFSFHSARHSFSVSTYQKTGKIFEISKMLGHASLDITTKYLQKFDTKKTEETQSAFVTNLRNRFVIKLD